MPLYEFECPKCKHKVDELCKWDEVIKCPKCSTLMKRAIGKANFQLKGDGWYKDHYGLKKSGDKK
jgi:putative FmdB family regulatory protein